MDLALTVAHLGDANEAVKGAKSFLAQAKSDQAELEHASNALQLLISSILNSQQSADQGFNNSEPSKGQRTTHSSHADVPVTIANQLHRVLQLTAKVKESSQRTGKACDFIAAQAQSLVDIWEPSTIDNINENQDESVAHCPDEKQVPITSH
jgi:hypothetical protein